MYIPNPAHSIRYIYISKGYINIPIMYIKKSKHRCVNLSPKITTSTLKHTVLIISPFLSLFRTHIYNIPIHFLYY